MFICFLSGVLMLFLLEKERQPTEAVLTALCIGPVGTIIGALIGVLAGTEKQLPVQAVTVQNLPSDPIPVVEEKT